MIWITIICISQQSQKWKTCTLTSHFTHDLSFEPESDLELIPQPHFTVSFSLLWLTAVDEFCIWFVYVLIKQFIPWELECLLWEKKGYLYFTLRLYLTLLGCVYCVCLSLPWSSAVLTAFKRVPLYTGYL